MSLKSLVRWLELPLHLIAPSPQSRIWKEPRGRQQAVVMRNLGSCWPDANVGSHYKHAMTVYGIVRSYLRPVAVETTSLQPVDAWEKDAQQTAARRPGAPGKITVHPLPELPIRCGGIQVLALVVRRAL